MKKISFVFPFFYTLFLITLSFNALGQSKVKSVPFAYLPDQSDDRYNQRITRKTIPVGENDFIILSRKTATSYSLERFGDDLKLKWSATLPLKPGETIDAFARNEKTAFVLVYAGSDEKNIQSITAYPVDINSGKNMPEKKLLESPFGRRLGSAISEDGTQIAVYKYQLANQTQIRAIDASLYDQNFTKLKDRNYNFRDVSGNLSVQVHIDNKGDQYISLITDSNTKIQVRRYTNADNEIKVMAIQVGGIFDGRQVYMFDTKFKLLQNQQLYMATFILDYKSGEYYSLKAIKFDFTESDMKFAEEQRFSAQYLTDVNSAYVKAGLTPAKRLEDISLSELVIGAENDLIIVAEKKMMAGGEDSDYLAKEMHLFAYNEFLAPAWRSVVMKNQKAPSAEGFTGISYTAKLFGSDLHILTSENQAGKSDLYLRKINIKTGVAEAPKALGLNVVNDKNQTYVKDFTAWLSEKTIIAVVKPNKKAAGLQLNKITVK